MDHDRDPTELARSILDANSYMTLGTADGSGRPWVSPVYYAPNGYAEFFWVSSPAARHSLNLAARPQVSIVVFDSRARIGAGQAVYMTGVAEQLTGPELDRAVEVFSRRSVAHGARPWTRQDVSEPEWPRLYRATVAEHWVLDATAQPPPGEIRDRRIPVSV